MLPRKVSSLGILFVIVLLAVTLFHAPLEAGSPYGESSTVAAEPALAPVVAKSNTVTTQVAQDGPPADPGTRNLNPLSADALNPPETCGVPLRGQFGEDAELLLLESPQTLWQIEALPAWKSKEDLPGLSGTAKPETEISAVAANSGEVFAVWRKSSTGFPNNDINHAIWAGSWEPATAAWLIEIEDRGRPVAVALEPENLGFLVRENNGILCKDYGQADWTGRMLPGLGENAVPASDPAVVAKDPQHVAVFYRDSQGGVWLAERYGPGLVCTGGTWRKDPISLSGAELIKKEKVYLPIISSKTSALIGQIGDSPLAAPSIYSAEAAPDFTLASDLSAASRNENHLAVFGVNDQNELWVKEWTNQNESDWRDTEWVKLMENVAIERPSVVSRHSNHLGLAIRAKSQNEARYIEWSTKSGWKDPISLGKGANGDLTAPLTLAATAKDAMSLFTVQQGQIWQRNWDEDAQWGSWQMVPNMPVSDSQRLTAVVRGPHDFMLLGLDPNNNGVVKQFTSFGKGFDASQQVSPNTSTGYRGQTLAWVDGEMLFAAPNPSGAQWQVDITSLVDKDKISHTLTGHTKSVDNYSDHAMAAADLDQDGSDELIFVSAPQVIGVYQVEISVLDLKISPTLDAETIASTTLTVPIFAELNTIVWDVNVAIGDLDGDAVRDEVVIAFYPLCFQTDPCEANRYVIVELFEFDPQAKQLVHRVERKFYDPDLGCKDNYNSGGGPGPHWCQFEDLAIAIDRINLQDKKERLIIADLLYQSYYINTDNKQYSEPSFLQTFALKDDVAPWQLNVEERWESGIELEKDKQDFSKIKHTEYIALETGDLDADGIDEIVHLGNGRNETTLFVIDLEEIDPTVGSRELAGLYSGSEPSMAVGDINQDGRAEVALVPPGTVPVKTSLFQLVGGKLRESNDHIPLYAAHYVLIGDLDNDSFVADLVGCNTVREVSVVAVLNSAPRWYDQAGDPIQEISATYAQSTEQGQSKTDGTSTSAGASLSIGIEVETEIPFGGPTFGYRASVENETMASWGFSNSRESSITEETGYNIDGDPGGMVVYSEFDYNCFYYEVYSPDDPTIKSRAMACQPTGTPSEQYHTLEHWHSPQFKASAGGSWVDLGHKSETGELTNLVTTYPKELPIDPETLKFIKSKAFNIVCDIGGGISGDWSITEAVGGAQEKTTSLENNTTISQGVTIGYATLDTSSTFGFGSESSRSVSWGEALSFTTGVEHFSDCDYQPYKARPFVYHAQARTEAGATYPYLELGWYVPEID